MGHRRSFVHIRFREGFTLVEILIVVTILAILAAMVLPRFSNAQKLSRENVLREDLRFMRSQIVIYSAEHRNIPPGYPDGDREAVPTAESFVAQMTHPTDMQGNVGEESTKVFRFGPYFSRMPENPVNGLATVRVLADDDELPEEAAGTHGWVFHPATLRLYSDATGADADGQTYYSY